MKKALSIILWTFCLMCIGCTDNKNVNGEKEVVFETTLGDIRVKLYNDTPGHRDNFIKNVNDGMYADVTFHRVIRNFMIQTGDPKTRHEGYPVKTDENGDTIVERIPAEVVYPTHFNKRGVLAAARDGDDENPQRMSDKFQFYIVTGKICTPEDLRSYETAREQRDAEALFAKKQIENKEQIDALRAARDKNKLSDVLEKLQDEARYEVSENPPLTFNKEQERAYKIHGGAPWLDGEYTVFGEVIEGMKIVEQIQKTKTNANDIPLREIRIKNVYVVE